MNAPRESSLEGVWALVRADFRGERAPDVVVEKTEIELVAGQYIVRFDGEIVDRGSYELDEAPAVHRMTLHGTRGTNAGRTIPCIYQFVGERLRICFGLDGLLPTAFTATSAEQRYVATYRRRRSG